MSTSFDERHMARALELAAVPDFTSPNPRVGTVLTKDGVVVAEAYHEGAGRPHAEAAALERCPDPRGATAYVTLEPCAHVGRTPPCSSALIAAGVSRVVVALVDPDERVRGRGIEALRAAGIEVEVGVLEDEVRGLLGPYLHHRRTHRPWVTLKLALSIDGRLGAPDGSSRWITQAGARAEVHRRRLAADAVMIGSGTALADDPRLDVRAVPASRQPARVVVDGGGRLPHDAALFAAGEVIVATTERSSHEARMGWKEAGAEVEVLPSGDGGVDLEALLDSLGRRGWLEVYCEGGARLATSLLRADLVNRLEIHRGAVVLGSGAVGLGDVGVATLPDARRWRLVDLERREDDVVTRYERAVL